MKTYKYISLIFIIATGLFLASCGSKTNQAKEEHEEEKHEENVVNISEIQNEALQLQFKPLEKMNLNEFVKASGKLQVPPQNQASISSSIGANVTDINIIEGDLVQKDQVLAYLSHPNLVKIQVEYQQTLNQLDYAQKDYERQKNLLENNVASGKQFQQVKANYHSLQSKVEGLAANLELLNMNPKKIAKGGLYRKVPVIATISGAVSKVEVTVGKYVEPQQELFEIVNTDELHADLKVFENDIINVKKGQKVVFQIGQNQKNTYEAIVKTVGKSFNETPRAILVHAVVDAKNQELIPGIFITGKIFTGEANVFAVPEEAVVTEGDKSFIFVMDNDHEEKEEHNHDAGETHEEKITLKMVEVLLGVKDRAYIEVKPLEKLDADAMIAQNSAYYLLAEMKKGEAEHAH